MENLYHGLPIHLLQIFLRGRTQIQLVRFTMVLLYLIDVRTEYIRVCFFRHFAFDWRTENGGHKVIDSSRFKQ